jgi:hypothetical protein
MLFSGVHEEIYTLTVKLFKKFSSKNNKPYKFRVPIFQKLGGLLINYYLWKKCFY